MQIDTALLHIYNAKKARALANLRILVEDPTAMGEHSDILTEAEKWIAEIAEADDCIETVQTYLGPKVTPE